MQGGAVPFFLAFVVVLALLARFIDRWEFYRFTDKESSQFCKPSVIQGTQAFGRDAAYLEPQELQVHDIVRFRVGRLGKENRQTLRIVATEGQRIAIEAGEVKVDGKPFDDRYSRFRLDTEWMAEVLVPARCVFLLGDERRSSAAVDGRTLGPVSIDAIEYDFGTREVSGGGGR
jgi:signal peptidase I